MTDGSIGPLWQIRPDGMLESLHGDDCAHKSELERAIEAEREACAKILDNYLAIDSSKTALELTGMPLQAVIHVFASDAARAIRARSKKGESK